MLAQFFERIASDGMPDNPWAYARKILENVIADEARKAKRRRDLADAHREEIGRETGAQDERDVGDARQIEDALAEVIDGPDDTPPARPWPAWSSLQECKAAVLLEVRSRAATANHWPGRWRWWSGPNGWMREAKENAARKAPRVARKRRTPVAGAHLDPAVLHEMFAHMNELAAQRGFRRIMLESLLSVHADDRNPQTGEPIRPTRADLALLALVAGDFPGTKAWQTKSVPELIECMATDLDAALSRARRGPNGGLLRPLQPAPGPAGPRAGSPAAAEAERRRAAAAIGRREAEERRLLEDPEVRRKLAEHWEATVGKVLKGEL
jgi:hypothetical protein